MSLPTTLQVRAFLRANGVHGSEMYTNKSVDHKGANRRVKFYYGNRPALLAALQKEYGAENVNLTTGVNYIAAPAAQGVTIRCVLE